MRKYVVFIIAIIIFSCAPKITRTVVGKRYKPVPYSERFVIFESPKDIDMEGEELIGEIEVKDSGLSINCDYFTVKGLGEIKAREIGGNCMVIIEHKTPDFLSSCHRVKCKVYRIENVEAFETQIEWRQDRKLQIKDFKGATDKRPFQAATVSAFSYRMSKSPMTGQHSLEIKSYFLCKKSYFKHSSEDEEILAHEQLHFDITEIYTRRFVERLLKECQSYKEAMVKHEQIYNEITDELILKQDEYDSEVYADQTKQSKWLEWGKTELKALEKYAPRKFTLNRK